MTHTLRPLLWLALLVAIGGGLGGCVAAAAVAGAEAASVTVFGRGIADIGVSAVTGRDCSTVRLDRGQSYCAPREVLPAVPVVCTRSLASVKCWVNPEALSATARPLADAPALTPAQTRQINTRWPKALNLFD
jgi:predicted NAD/FAD-dependent oxidoreductase